MTTHEPEITRDVALCDARGRLNRDAVGWSRHPYHVADFAGRTLRVKRWEYWGIVTPDHIVGLTVSDIGYAAVNSIYVLDRASRREVRHDAVVPLRRHTTLPARCGVGRAEYQGRAFAIRVSHEGPQVLVRATADDLDIDLVVHRGDRESLGVVVPWSDRLFQYTVKDVGAPVTGTIRVGGAEVPVDGHDSFAVLDHGRGRWPYSVTWNWAAGAGQGRGITLGGRWTDGTGMTENAVVVDGRLHKIAATLRWSYDRDDWLRPWRIEGEGVELRFEPFHDRVARTNLGVIASSTHQCFGTFSGWVEDGEGERMSADGLTGWAEESVNRW